MMTTRDETLVRRAQPHEAEALNELILRSKGFWGYDPSFVEAYRSFLSLSPEAIEHTPIYCAEVGSRLAGVLRLTVLNEMEIELDLLFVEPTFIGQGIGTLLWRHAIDLARSMGAKTLMFDADPHARPFYERMGAVVINDHLSTVITGLRIPRMRYAL